MWRYINSQTKLDLRCVSVFARVDFSADNSSFLLDSKAAAAAAADGDGDDDDDDDATVGLSCCHIRQGNANVMPISSPINDRFHTTTNRIIRIVNTQVNSKTQSC